MLARRLLYPVLLSILAAVATVVLKYVAYHLTDSVGLLSDAAESLANVLSSLTALLSLYYASQPVDVNHTYGHEKIEYFSSGIEGILILAAAVGIVWFAIRRLMEPAELQALDAGLLVSFIASLINLAVARILLRAGREAGSVILEADGRHLMSDVWVSAGILVGVGLVRVTGLQFLDPLLALVVATYVVWTGGDLVWRSFDGLMDHALPTTEQEKVRAAIEANLATDMDYHALRTRQAAAHRFADFHLLVPGDQSVRQAHAVATRIEQAVRQAVPGIEITIHIEPIEELASWADSALLPIERAARRQRDQEKQQKRD